MKHIYTILISLLLCPFTGYAQGVSVEAKIDSIAILIGEQTAHKDKTIKMPDLQVRQMITPGVEIVDIINGDTTDIADNMRTISRKYLLTSFDENAYMIPPLNVKVDGKDYQTNALALKVLTVDVDTLHLNQYFGPKDVQDNPFSWKEWSPLFWLSVLMMLLIGIAGYLYIPCAYHKAYSCSSEGSHRHRKDKAGEEAELR